MGRSGKAITLKKILNVAGGMLGLAGVVFVLNKLFEYGDQIDLVRLGRFTWLSILGLSIGFGCASYLLAVAWRNLLAHLGARISLPQAIHIYGISQLAKYLPGNIFHFAGRQALGVAAGLAGWAVALSALWEVGTIVVIGIPFIALALPLIEPQVGLYQGLAFFFILSALLLWAARRFWGPSILRSALWYIIFLAASGLIFVSIIITFTPAGAPGVTSPAK